MSRASALREWERRTGEPFQPSDWALVAPSAPLPPCPAPCGWCTQQSPCGAMKRAMRRWAS